MTGERPFLLGETFTHENGFNQIRYYLGPESLSSQFDFTLMWGLRSFLNGHTSGILFSDLIETGIEAWDIPEVHMAPIIGNHDVPRIATVMNALQDEELHLDSAFDDISALMAEDIAGLDGQCHSARLTPFFIMAMSGLPAVPMTS